MENFIQTVTDINNIINDFVWVKLGIAILLGTGVLMTVLTKFFQVTHIGHWMKNTLGAIFKKDVSGHTKDKTISQFQSLCTALAATVGVGNIAGVATAIVVGGPGAVFWMWVAAFFGMMTNYSENVLGIFYRRKNINNEWSGGSMYFLQDGLGRYKGCKYVGKVLAVLFSIFAILASFGIGNMGQVNKIVANIESAFKIPALDTIVFGETTLYAVLIGVVLLILAAVIIVGGLKRIAEVAEKIVPVMVVLYVLGSLIIIFVNVTEIIPALASIFKMAFKGDAVWGGAAGVLISKAMTQGFKRGIFSNEAGLGSSVMVHSSSNVVEPVRQGMWGIFEVFADTMVVCTMTALTILTSGVINLQTGDLVEGASDSTLVGTAFDTIFKVGNVHIGSMFIAITVFLFAFTTVLGWSQYGTKAWEYLFGTKATIVYKVIFTVMIMSGALMTSSLAWDISDTFNGLMMIPNLIGVAALSPVVMLLTKNYIDRRIKGKDVKPMLNFDPHVQAEEEAKLKADKDAL